MCSVVDEVSSLCFFFFNDTATTEIYTLSLHDALPIWSTPRREKRYALATAPILEAVSASAEKPSPSSSACKESRLATSTSGGRSEEHTSELQSRISYAVFCLKKKNITPVPSTDAALAI